MKSFKDIKTVIVDKKDFSQTLGALIGLREKTNEVCSEPFGETMAVFVNFDSPSLDEILKILREKKIFTQLKATATQTNINWKCTDLEKELKREREAFLKGAVKSENT
jgi:hypothetical protein